MNDRFRSGRGLVELPVRVAPGGLIAFLRMAGIGALPPFHSDTGAKAPFTFDNEGSARQSWLSPPRSIIPQSTIVAGQSSAIGSCAAERAFPPITARSGSPSISRRIGRRRTSAPTGTWRRRKTSRSCGATLRTPQTSHPASSIGISGKVGFSAVRTHAPFGFFSA